MEKDLFGTSIVRRKRTSKLEASLKKYDEQTFSERLERLKFINKILPKNYAFGADLETIYIFNEAKMTFINGQYISTILLSQSFIERKLQSHYESIGLGNISKRGLKAIIDHAEKNDTLNHDFFLKKIDLLRKKRNPFVHLKEYTHEFNMSQRLFIAVKENLPKNKSIKQPEELMEQDAKEAISLMYLVFVIDI